MTSPEPITTPGIHDQPSEPVAVPFTPQQFAGIGQSLLNGVGAFVLYALSGVQVFGIAPFGFLRSWADNLAQTANDAYHGAQNAQASANYANSQLLGMFSDNLASDVSGGVALTERFDGDPANDLGPHFDRVSFGSGGGFYGLDGSGLAIWKPSGGVGRGHHDRHVTPLTTRYQVVMALLSQPPVPPFGGGQAVNELRGRVNAAQDAFVFLALTESGFRVGCQVSGSDTIFADVFPVPVATGDLWALYLGTDDSDYEFIVKRNGSEVYRYTDTGAISQVDDTDYLYTGLTAYAADRSTPGIFGILSPFTAQTAPAALDVWAAADRLPTST